MIRAERSTSQLWRDRELAEFMVKGLGTEDRIMSYKMVDSEDDRSDETYVLKRSGGQFRAEIPEWRLCGRSIRNRSRHA